MFQSFSADVINSLSPLELEVLRYISTHKDEIAGMSIHDLAKTAFVSTTTIIRLCKKLNLDGYSHLKYFLRDKALSSRQEENIYASRSLQELLAEELSDIERTAKAIDLHAVNEIAALMHQKTQIHFFAKGLTSIAIPFQTCNFISRHPYCLHSGRAADAKRHCLSCFTKRRNRAGCSRGPNCPGTQCKNRSFHR